MQETKIDVMSEDRPPEVGVEGVQRLIDLALKKGKSRSWTLDEVCELGGYPSSTLRGDDYVLIGVTHFTKEAALKLEAKIAELPDASSPNDEDIKELKNRGAEFGFMADEIDEIIGEFWPSHSVPMTWAQYDAISEALITRLNARDKTFKEDHLDGKDLEDQLDALFERDDQELREERAKKELEAKQEQALNELGFGDPKPEASSSESTKHQDQIEPSSESSKTEDLKASEPLSTSPDKASKGSKKGSKKSKKESDAPAKRSEDGDVEYGFTEDPADYVFNAFRLQKIELALVEINTRLQEANNPIRLNVNRGPVPTFGLNFETATQDQIDFACSLISEELKDELKRACKHVMTALSAVTRKQAEIELLTKNYEALKRELEADLSAIQNCYGGEIHEWSLRQLEKNRKPDGSFRTKTIKTLAGVISFTKTGGRKVDQKELLASILEKPEEERALFPVREEVVHVLDLDEMKTSGLLDAWEDLGLRGVTDLPEDPIGKITLSPKPRGESV